MTSSSGSRAQGDTLLLFETILALLLGAALLSMVAGKIGVPYPTLLALGGIGLALAPVHGSFEAADILPAFFLVSVASVAVGYVLARLIGRATALIHDPATATIIQLVTTFGIWMLADRLGLSSVITIVSFGITAGRRASEGSPTEVRIKSFAAWEAATMVLNVLAFTMIGLQLRPIADSLTAEQWKVYPLYGLAILLIAISVRLVWVFVHGATPKLFVRGSDELLGTWRGTFKSGLVVGWSGMRGIVTVAAALALPADFPHREFILLVAFIVVLGTLVVQGLTLKPLLKLLKFPADTVVANEIRLGREAAIRAGLATLDKEKSAAGLRLQQELAEALKTYDASREFRYTSDSLLRRQMVPACCRAIDRLRDDSTIGDGAYRLLEQELDWFELGASVG